MGIKPKELEGLILELLETSPAIQNKIRSMCSSASATLRTAVHSDETPRKVSSEAEIRYLKEQIEKYQRASTEATAKLQQERDRSQSIISKLEDEKQRLAQSVIRKETEMQQKIDTLNAEHKNEIGQMNESNQTLTDQLKKAEKALQKLTDRFSEPIFLLEQYRSLSASIRTGLSDIICDTDEVLFIASGSSPEHLKAIWNYTKKLAGNNSDPEGFAVLKNIFDYFFEIFNNSLSEPLYERDCVEPGYSFDDDKYDRCIGSATSGTITEVVLRGYRSINTGNAICRSVVLV